MSSSPQHQTSAWVTFALLTAFSTLTRAECLIPTRQLVLSNEVALLGRVITIRELDEQKRYVLATMAVERAWKGTPAARVSVASDTFAVESPRFVVGELYLLHASAITLDRAKELALPSATLWANICSGIPSTSNDFWRLLRELGRGLPVK